MIHRFIVKHPGAWMVQYPLPNVSGKDLLGFDVLGTFRLDLSLHGQSPFELDFYVDDTNLLELSLHSQSPFELALYVDDADLTANQLTRVQQGLTDA